MALASQSGRPVSRRYMYRRRRRRSGRWLALLLLVVVAGLITWGFWTSPKDTHATAPSPVTTTPTTTPTSTPTPDPVASVNTHPNNTSRPTTTPSNSRLEAARPEPASTPTAKPAIATSTPEVINTTAGENTAPGRSTSQPSDTTTIDTRPAGTSPLAEALALSETDPFATRLRLSNLVESRSLSPEDAARARQELTLLGERIFFDPSLLPGDKFARHYTVQSGDSLARIAKRQSDVNVEWGMIQLMNRLPDPTHIRPKQKLKVPVGTFHAVVYKSDYVLDLHVENDEGRIIVASFPVGLGEYNGTPVGRFNVRTHSKLENPQWRNPRTGAFFLPDDPKNPIGERWIGLEGAESSNSELTGYGIHGTIDPDSIGENRSMGCIRLLDPHVKLVYEALVERGSSIEIRP